MSSPSQDDLLRLALPSLSPELVPAEALSSVRRCARQMAPIYRGGIECHLSENANRVDLHQSVVARDSEPLQLRQHIMASPALAHPAWRRVSELCAEWAEPASPVHKTLRDIWLEVDISGGSNASFVPSIFLGLTGLDSNGHIEQLPVGLAMALDLLGQNPPVDTLLRIARCCAAASPALRITHVGVMLARPAKHLRLNVAGVQVGGLQSFLACIGWNYSSDELVDLFRLLRDLVDKIVLTLDVDESVGPKVGLECFIRQQPPEDQSWPVLLDHLTEMELCSVQQRSALLLWPGLTDPVDNHDAWPEQLITRSLVSQPDFFSVFVRRLSHIKIDYHPGQPLLAKAYLSLAHVWAS